MTVDAVLHEFDLPLSRALNMKPGETIMFDRGPSEPGKAALRRGRAHPGPDGPYRNHVSVRVTRPLNPAKGDDGGVRGLGQNAGGSLTVGFSFGMLVEGSVAILLVVTIGYCASSTSG